MFCCIIVCAHYLPRNGRNNVLIGLPDVVKERKLSKIVINRKLPNIYYFISSEFPIQNFHITRYYSDGEYCHSFVIAAERTIFVKDDFDSCICIIFPLELTSPR